MHIETTRTAEVDWLLRFMPYWCERLHDGRDLPATVQGWNERMGPGGDFIAHSELVRDLNCPGSRYAAQ